MVNSSAVWEKLKENRQALALVLAALGNTQGGGQSIASHFPPDFVWHLVWFTSVGLEHIHSSPTVSFAALHLALPQESWALHHYVTLPGN